MLFFIFIKLVFLLFHFSQSSEIGLIDSIRVIWFGLKLDISASSYLMVLPVIFIITGAYGGKMLHYNFFKIYTLFFLSLFVILSIVDMELYKHWGYRIDATPLMYLNTPGEMFASISFGMFIRQLIIGFIMFLLFWILFQKIFKPQLKKIERSDWRSSIVFLFILVSLIIPVRGGIGIAPLNTGSAYFHHNVFANHAANNLVWNLGYSLANLNPSGPEWTFMDEKKADKEFNKLLKPSDTTKKLISGKPNIIIIILESFTSKIIEPLKGRIGISPEFSKLSEEGILFTNFFASGDRSDKGIVSILSGYPAQPNRSVIKFPNKTQSLPGLNKSLNSKGYSSGFYYGGEIDFANFRSYLVNMGYEKIISIDDFDKSLYNSKWGVHDHILLKRFLGDMDSVKEPFFQVVFTLSSHEPFDVPMETIIQGKDDESMFLNSAYYTDNSLGEFINEAKTKNWWDNTLVVIVSDHGCRHPGNSKNYMEDKFRIPMLWIGGAIKDVPQKIDVFCSQNDIAKTILNQLEGISSNDYTFSKDIFANTTYHFGFYTFKNGFGYFSNGTSLVYDLINTYAVVKDGENFKEDLLNAKAFLQVLSNDFNLR